MTTALRAGFGANPVALYTFTVPAGTAPGTYQFSFGPARKTWFRPTPVLTRGVIVVP